MPAARSHQQCRDVFAEGVLLAFGAGETDIVTNRVAHVDLPRHLVVPVRRVRVLEVGHVHFGAGVQRIDNHLAIGRAGDLGTTVLQIGGNRCDGPLGFTYWRSLGQKVG